MASRKKRRAELAHDPRIPEKEYFRIGEVAALAGVETYVLRFWETEFPALKPAKGKTSQRVYGRADVELVLRIRDLLYDDGFTIEGARRQLKQGRERGDPQAVPSRTQQVLKVVRKEAQELLRLVGD